MTPEQSTATSGARGTSRFAMAARRVRPVDDAAAVAAETRTATLTKPPGSLGRLEPLGTRLAAIARRCPPPIPHPAAVCLFAADHGVVAEGVTGWPQQVTSQMVANFCSGGAAINVLARAAGAAVHITDVGVATPIPGDTSTVLDRSIRPGTANLAAGPAMTAAEARRSLDVGAEVAATAVERGAAMLVTGEMGIGNTTAAAAVVAAVTGLPADEVTGRGTGIDDVRLARKTEVIAVAVTGLDGADALAVLARVGGLEIGAMAGLIVGGAAAGVPVIIDGVIAAAAALLAVALVPDAVGYLIAGHRSAEPGASAALRHLGLTPLLELDLRLGEGTGAALAIPLVQAAARILSEMATFDDAAVSASDAAAGS